MALIEVSFPGGKKVDSDIKGFTVATDQPIHSGGEGAAPSPFDLFLSSIATCAGFYAQSFCQNKGINTEGLKLEMDVSRDSSGGLIDKIDMKLTLPMDFPEKYEQAILRAMDLCTVKKHLLSPPEFNITTIK